MVTNASNQEIKKVFKNATFHLIPSGLEFAYVEYPGEVIDVASCVNIPAEFYGLKGVPDFDPTQMYSGSFVSDSFQRDLTINAIYYDVQTGDIVDYHGGLHDIREHILQTMVDAESAFEADPRISIRAMRFKARYGFNFSDRMDEVLRAGVAKYVTEPGPVSNSFNIPKFFDGGYALNSYEVLEEYGAFPILFAPVADTSAQDDYKTYMISAMKQMDDWEANGDEFSRNLYIAVILWPIFEGADKEKIQKMSKEVLSQQSKTIMINDEDMDDYTDLFILEKMLEEDLSYEDSAKIVTQNEFEDAYDLLVLRSLTDENLTDEVDYWTKMREELLYDEMDIAA